MPFNWQPAFLAAHINVANWWLTIISPPKISVTMGTNAGQFGQRGRYCVDLSHYAYDLTDATPLPRERDLHGRLRPYRFYRARCAKCGKSVILRSWNTEFISPPIKLVRLDECDCGCWTCGKPIDRGNSIIGSRRCTGQHRTNTRYCSDACRQKAYRLRRVKIIAKTNE